MCCGMVGLVDVLPYLCVLVGAPGLVRVGRVSQAARAVVLGMTYNAGDLMEMVRHAVGGAREEEARAGRAGHVVHLLAVFSDLRWARAPLCDLVVQAWRSRELGAWHEYVVRAGNWITAVMQDVYEAIRERGVVDLMEEVSWQEGTQAGVGFELRWPRAVWQTNYRHQGPPPGYVGDPVY